MSQNLWYIYDYDSCRCDECGRDDISCAIWRKAETDEFLAVCGYCDQEFTEKKLFANGSE